MLSWHVPNGMMSNRKNVLDMKRIGLTPGIPDYWVVLSNGKIAAIEFKSSRGKANEEQIRIGNILSTAGINYAVCKSSHEAVQFIENLM